MMTSTRQPNRRHLLATGSVLLLTTLCIGGVTSADAASSGAAYSGCLSKPLKVVYNVTVNAATPPRCSGADPAIGWNQTGPTGATGPSGEIGTPGPVGATGPKGDPGATGLSGATGNTGPTGPVGLTGTTGTAGQAGPLGPAGAVGLTGLKGDLGATGLPGAIGPAGTTGLTGPKGDTGATGPAGPGANQFGNNTQTASAGTASGAPCYLGQILLTAGSIADGVPASGQTEFIRENPALFSLLGTTYGGDGQITYNLPNLTSAAPNGMTYSICTQGIYPSRP